MLIGWCKLDQNNFFMHRCWWPLFYFSIIVDEKPFVRIIFSFNAVNGWWPYLGALFIWTLPSFEHFHYLSTLITRTLSSWRFLSVIIASERLHQHSAHRVILKPINVLKAAAKVADNHQVSQSVTASSRQAVGRWGRAQWKSDINHDGRRTAAMIVIVCCRAEWSHPSHWQQQCWLAVVWLWLLLPLSLTDRPRSGDNREPLRVNTGWPQQRRQEVVGTHALSYQYSCHAQQCADKVKFTFSAWKYTTASLWLARRCPACSSLMSCHRHSQCSLHRTRRLSRFANFKWLYKWMEWCRQER